MKYILLLSFCWTSFSSFAQFEICDNGIDDDGDGTIDYYDSDCSNDPNNPNEYISHEAACTSSPTNVSFEAEPAWDSDVRTSAALGMPSVADLDQDGYPEVISMNSETGWLYVLDGRTGSTLNQVRVKTGQLYAYPTVGDVDGDGFGEIFTIDLNGVIRAYEHDLTLKWTATSTFTGFGRHLALADFNHDGKAELYSVNEIWDAETGMLLIKGSHGSSMYPSANDWHQELNATPAAVDILPFPGLELAVGHIIYTVNISNTGGTSGNSLTEAKNMNDAGLLPADYVGYYPADVDWANQNYSQTTVVDYNQDGNLDVLMGGANGGIDSITTAFFWDIANDAVKTFAITRPGNTIPAIVSGTFSDLNGNNCDSGDSCYWERGLGSISVADIDGDGQLEATFSSGSSLYALETNFSEKWVNHDDFWDSSSGITTPTVFDLDGDGINEILYRDEIDLYVIDGITGRPLNNQISGTFCSSQTFAEYPIIADVNGDGETEIILSCGQAENTFGAAPATSGTRTNGFIRAYKAAQGNGWAPARKVWNQYAYYNVNINDDLSIPRYQQAHHLDFAQTCSDPNAPAAFPLNKFLSQSPKLNHCGQPTFATAKLDFVNESIVVTPPTCPDNQIEVRVIFQNSGDQTIAKPVPVSFYAANPTNSYSNTDASPYLETVDIDIPGGIKAGDTVDITIPLTGLRGIFTLFVSLNDIGQKDSLGVPMTNEAFYPLTKLNGSIRECDDTPTLFSKMVVPQPFEVKAIKIRDNRNCPGEVSLNNGEVQVLAPDNTPFPASSYAFTWTNIQTGQVVGTNALLTSLDSGTYQIIVENTDYGCFSLADTIRVERLEDWPDTQVITVEELQPVSSCVPGTADGIARVLINGQVADESEYDIEWEDEQQAGVLAIGDTATNLKPILYKVTVTNKLTGCSDNETIDMTLDGPVMGYPTITANTNCKSPNGTISAQLLSGSTTDYDYILLQLSPFIDTIYNDNPSFSSLAAGLYELRAYDPDTECGYYSEGIEVEVTEEFSFDEISVEEVSPQTACKAPYNGQLQAVIANPSMYDFVWYRGTVTTGPTAEIVATDYITPDTLGTNLTNIYTVIATRLSSGCSVSQQIQLTENIPSADFSYAYSAYCQDNSNPLPEIHTLGGTFSSTSPGLVLDANTGEIDLAASTLGTYNITYALNESCIQESSFEVSVHAADEASFSYTQPSYCQSEANPVANILGSSGGTFSSTSGLVFANSITGEIDLASSVAGVHTITYTTSGACPAMSTFDITIHEAPAIASTDAYFVKCDGFTLHWNDHNYNIDGYSVQVANDAAFTNLILDSLTTVKEDIDLTGLNAGDTYYFRVGITSDCGTNYSETNEVTLIGLPVSFPRTYVTQVTESSISLNWDSVQYAENYYIELDDDDQFSSVDESLSTWGENVTFTSLRTDTDYFIRLQAVNECGAGPDTLLHVTTTIDPLVSDSLALVALYHATDGENWTRNDNWLTGPLDTWYGVDLHGSNRVLEINLDDNNLVNALPSEVNKLTALSYFNLGDNDIHTIPDSLFYYSGSGHMYSNRLTFEDIINQPRFPAKLYDQQLVGKDTTVYLYEGESYTISLGIDESVPDNEYVWMKDSVVIATTNVNYFTISDYQAEDAGTYTCQITNPRGSNFYLVLHSHPVHVNPVNKQPSLTVSKKESCPGEPITFYAEGRNSLETYQWRLINSQGMYIGLPDSLRTAQTFSYNLNQTGTYSAELTLSSYFYPDTVLVNYFNIKSLPEISLNESANLVTDSLMLTAIEGYAADTLTFEWHKIEGQEHISIGSENTLWIKEGGTYGVNVINPTGCQAEAEVFVIDVRPEAQSISFDSIPDKVYGESFELNAIASSGLAVAFEVTEGQELVSLSDQTVNILGVGTVTIKANQSGNGEYLAAKPVSQSFNIHKAPQQISFTAIPDMLLEEGSFILEASSNVGLPLTFAFDGSIALSGKKVTLLDSGLVSITASQEGNEHYLPAEAVTYSFNVTKDIVIEKDTIHQLTIRIDTITNNLFPLRLSLFKKQNGVYKLVSQERMFTASLSYENLAEGEYTLKIKAEQGPFLPTYLGQHLLLSEAESISLTQDTEVSLRPISIPEVLKEIGITLRGRFIQNAQASNGRLMVSKEMLDGIPVVGLTIYLINNQDQSLVASTVTDGDGKFVFTHLPPGNYSIKADHKALPMDASASFEVAQQSLELTVVAGEEISIVAKEEIEEEVTAIEDEIRQQLKFYPNPVEDVLYLQIPSALLGGELKIFDAHGKLVFTAAINDTKINCSLSHLSSGHYQLQITHQGKTYALKILKR